MIDGLPFIVRFIKRLLIIDKFLNVFDNLKKDQH